MLARAPQITRQLTPFEEAFYFYQRRLNERLSIPFTRYFYVKKDTPADIEWKQKALASKERGDYDAYGLHRDKDELKCESEESTSEAQAARLLGNAETPATATSFGDVSTSDKERLERPLSRRTQADEDLDYKSLNRKLDRSLYLAVKGEDKWYRLPSSSLLEREHLVTGAERVLAQTAGINMNTWFVGHAPIGHAQIEEKKQKGGLTEGEKSDRSTKEKIFFMKARIMAGQADLAGNKFGFTDWKWLCKEELARFCQPSYFAGIKNLLAER